MALIHSTTSLLTSYFERQLFQQQQQQIKVIHWTNKSGAVEKYQNSTTHSNIFWQPSRTPINERKTKTEDVAIFPFGKNADEAKFELDSPSSKWKKNFSSKKFHKHSMVEFVNEIHAHTHTLDTSNWTYTV